MVESGLKWSEYLGKSSKKNGLFTVRLTVRVYPPPPPYGQGVVIFQNKLTYFDLFYHFIMGKIGPKFSHLLTVRP